MSDTSGLRERFFNLYFPDLQPWQSKLLDKCIGNARADDVRAEIKSARPRDGGGSADPGVAAATDGSNGSGVRAHKGNVDPAIGKDIAAIYAQYDPRSQAYRVEALDGAVQFITAPRGEQHDAILGVCDKLVRAGNQRAANALMKCLVDSVALAPMPAMLVRHDAALIYKKPCDWTDAEWKQHYARPRGKGKPADAAMVGWEPFREGA